MTPWPRYTVNFRTRMVVSLCLFFFNCNYQWHERLHRERWTTRLTLTKVDDTLDWQSVNQRGIMNGVEWEITHKKKEQCKYPLCELLHYGKVNNKPPNHWNNLYPKIDCQRKGRKHPGPIASQYHDACETGCGVGTDPTTATRTHNLTHDTHTHTHTLMWVVAETHLFGFVIKNSYSRITFLNDVFPMVDPHHAHTHTHTCTHAHTVMGIRCHRTHIIALWIMESFPEVGVNLLTASNHTFYSIIDFFFLL